jgi:hypothetical protein
MSGWLFLLIIIAGNTKLCDVRRMALSGCYFFWLKPSYYKMWGGFIFVLVMASRFSTTLELTRHFENLRVTGVGQALDRLRMTM